MAHHRQSSCQQYAVSRTSGRVSQPKVACLGPFKSQVLESILFLIFASISQEEVKVLAGGQEAVWELCLFCLALGVPRSFRTLTPEREETRHSCKLDEAEGGGQGLLPSVSQLH